MRMVFHFKMSVGDYREMMFYRTFGTSKLRRWLLFGTWAVFLLLLIGDWIHVVALSRVVHICALLVSVAVPASFITMEINVSQYKDAYLAGFKAERQIIADDEGLTFTNQMAKESGFNPWSDVTKLEEMKHVFVIQLNHKEAVILPKRGMGDHTKVETFIGMVKEHVPDAYCPME